MFFRALTLSEIILFLCLLSGQSISFSIYNLHELDKITQGTKSHLRITQGYKSLSV